MKKRDFEKEYPNKVWIVTFCTICSYHDIEKLFLTEEEARDYYNSLSEAALHKKIYQVLDIWGWSEKETALRNWIESSLKRRISGSPVYVGRRGGRKCYEVNLEDGTSKDYYIDFDNKTIEEVLLYD